MKPNQSLLLPAGPKPRARAVNDVLMSRKPGRMKGPRDFDRNQEKRDLRSLLRGC